MLQQRANPTTGRTHDEGVPMRRAKNAISIAAVLSALALSGCGSPSATGSAGTALPATTTVAKVALTSPAIHGIALPALYTCDGKNVSPPLTWGTVPSSVEELTVFALGYKRGVSLQPSIEWAMGGVNPSLHKLAAGQVPANAFLLTASSGKKYSICPAQGQTEDYVFGVYALPRGIHATPEISGFGLFHNLTEATPQDRAPAVGRFTVHYTRG
jgi:hypothetical protein